MFEGDWIVGQWEIGFDDDVEIVDGYVSCKWWKMLVCMMYNIRESMPFLVPCLVVLINANVVLGVVPGITHLSTIMIRCLQSTRYSHGFCM